MKESALFTRWWQDAFSQRGQRKKGFRQRGNKGKSNGDQLASLFGHYFARTKQFLLDWRGEKRRCSGKWVKKRWIISVCSAIHRYNDGNWGSALNGVASHILEIPYSLESCSSLFYEPLLTREREGEREKIPNIKLSDTSQ